VLLLEVDEVFTKKHDLRNVSIPFGICSYGCATSNLFQVFGPDGCKHPVVVGDGCVKSWLHGDTMSIPLVGNDLWRTGSSENTMEALVKEHNNELLLEDKREWSDSEEQGVTNLTKSKRKRVVSAKAAVVLSDDEGPEETDEEKEPVAAAAHPAVVVTAAGKRAQKKK